MFSEYGRNKLQYPQLRFHTNIIQSRIAVFLSPWNEPSKAGLVDGVDFRQLDN